MRKISFLLLIPLILSACAPTVTQTPAAPTSAVTLEVLSTSTPETEPSMTPTATPTATESVQTDLQNLKYSEKELAAFSKITREGNALVGIRISDGTPQTLAIQMNTENGKEMVRIGEWNDGEGNTFRVFVNTKYDPLHRILTTEDTPKTLIPFLLDRLAQGQFFDLTAGVNQALKNLIFNAKNYAKTFLDLPVADPDNGDWAVKWVRSETEADFSLPIEVMTVFGKDADEFMKTHPLAKYVMDYRGVEDGNEVFGGLVWVAEDGHVQIIIVDSAPGAADGLRWIPKDLSEKKNVETVLKQRVGWSLFAILNTFNHWQDSDAWMLESKYSRAQFDALSRETWDYSVDLK